MKKDIHVDVKREAIALITNIAYKNAGYWYNETERALKLSMYVPKHREGHRKMPLLVWLCGGAFQVVDKDVWMPQLLPFAEQGYIVASVEYRTSDNAPFPAALTDVKSAIRFLKAHSDRYCIDKNRVFIMGESAGGALACQVGIMKDVPEYDTGDFLQESSSVNGVISFYAPVDYETHTEEIADPLMYSAFEQYFGGRPEEKKEMLNKMSPIHYVSPDTVPFLIFHGTEDEKVEVSQSEKFYEELVKNGVDCDFYRLLGAKHGVDEFYQKEIIEIILEFLKRNS